MSGGIIYAATRADVRDAIVLLNVLASNEIGTLWCGDGKAPAFASAACGHSDDWNCAAEALGLSSDAVWLAIAAAVRVRGAWSDLETRADEHLRILAPAHEATLVSDDGEAECLLREGWLPSDWRLVRRHSADRGHYIDLAWDDSPETYYVRGHVENVDFVHALRTGISAHRMPAIGTIRHAHARWAFNGSDRYGNAKRILSECGGRDRGAFTITAMDHVKEAATS